MSRADKIRPKERQPEYYSDFSINLERNQVTGQLKRLTNDESVKQAIVTLVLTNQKERPYQPWIGSRVKESLFNLMVDDLSIEQIKESIEQCLLNNEPRVKIQQIKAQEIDNGYNVQIVFTTINLQEPQVVDIIIERIR